MFELKIKAVQKRCSTTNSKQVTRAQVKKNWAFLKSLPKRQNTKQTVPIFFPQGVYKMDCNTHIALSLWQFGATAEPKLGTDGQENTLSVARVFLETDVYLNRRDRNFAL